MKKAYLEHINITVKSPEELAALFCRIFDWEIRWEGASLDNGRSIHVGSDNSYLALYTHNNLSHEGLVTEKTRSYLRNNNLNHIGIVVDDLDKVEAKIIQEGFMPCDYGDYDPGRRFYFSVDRLEIEVISYAVRED